MKRECFDDFDTRKRLRPDGAGGGWEKVGMKRRQWMDLLSKNGFAYLLPNHSAAGQLPSQLG